MNIKHILLFSLFFVIGFATILVSKKYAVAHPAVTSPLATTTLFSLDIPPSKSQSGEIVSLSGEVEWQSRSATEPAKLTQKQKVLQGEEFWTKESGNLHISFQNILELNVLPNTYVSVIQTLPTNIVLKQEGGEVVYKNSGASPLGIRARHLLIQQESGILNIKMNNTTPTIRVSVQKGSAKIAFNNADFETNVVTLEEGDTYIFNDETRTGRIING